MAHHLLWKGSRHSFPSAHPVMASSRCPLLPPLALEDLMDLGASSLAPSATSDLLLGAPDSVTAFCLPGLGSVQS